MEVLCAACTASNRLFEDTNYVKVLIVEQNTLLLEVV